MIFCLFNCFHQTINKKHWILPKYIFSKKIINDVLFNVFRSINGILNKTPFTSIIYAIWIKKKILPKKWLFEVFFHIFICWWKKTKKIHFLSRQYFFSLKITKITYFYPFILNLRQYIYFSLKPHKWPSFQCFFGDLLLLKENHLFYEKNMILHQKSLF